MTENLIHISVVEPEIVNVDVERQKPIEIEVLSTLARYDTLDEYKGYTEFVPSEDEQIVHTESKYLSKNIVIRAIPNNFARIAHNGSGLKFY